MEIQNQQFCTTMGNGR